MPPFLNDFLSFLSSPDLNSVSEVLRVMLPLNFQLPFSAQKGKSVIVTLASQALLGNQVGL